MSCDNCASNGNVFCAAGNIAAFEDGGSGCHDWSPKTKIIMFDGSIQNIQEISADDLYADDLYTVYDDVPQEQAELNWGQRAVLSFGMCWIFSMLVGASLVLANVGVNVICNTIIHDCQKR